MSSQGRAVGIQFCLIGSRARHAHRPGSDIDVVVYGEGPLLQAAEKLLKPFSIENAGPLDLFSEGSEGDLWAHFSETMRRIEVDGPEHRDAIFDGAREITLAELLQLCAEVVPAWQQACKPERTPTCADAHAEVTADLALLDAAAKVLAAKRTTPSRRMRR